ncbi:MAG: tetratricopeptide repeat protein [Rivularia sp. (in: Bacteria)]|nr:tetratricopeptide repeat protein [Rivularia sp. MS3]
MSKELEIFNKITNTCYPVQNKNAKNKKIKQWLAVSFYCLLTTSLVALPIFINNEPAQARKSSLSLVKQGNRLLKKGWVDDAIQVFRRAIKRNPQSLQANLGLAIAYKRAGNINAAWDSYQRVLSIDPNNQLALKTIGLFGTYRPQWQVGGIKALNTLLNLSPNDFQARSLRALLYYYQGRINDSVADYQILLTNNPTPEIIVGAAETYTYAQNYTEAIELFQRYLSTGRNLSANAAIAYGRALQKTGNPTQAIEILEAQLRGSNSSDSLALTARAELSQAYLANNQQAQALAVLQPLRSRQDAVLLLAGALNEIRKRTNDSALAEEVASLYQQALANNPNPSPLLLLQVADVFSGLPKGEKIALQLYQQAGAKLPNDKSLVLRQLALENKLGLINQNSFEGRLTQALQNPPQDAVELQKFASALVQINTRNPEFIPGYRSILRTGVDAPFLNFRIAQMYLQQKDTIAARSALAAYTATREGTNSLAAQLLAAEIELQEGNIEASARRYQAVLNTNPDNDEITDGALRALAGLRSQQKRFDQALGYYNQLLARQPQNPTYQLGQISVGYQANKINQQQATTVLNNWLATQKATSTPPELYSLVGQLPAAAKWEPLYKYLLQLEPNNIQIQERWLQVVAQRNPAKAKALVKQFAAASQSNSTLVEGQLSKAIGDLNLAGIAYEKVLTNQPDNMDALAALGGIRFEQRRYEAAEKIYSQMLMQKPQDPEARMAIADLNTILDKPLAALAQMEQLQIQQMSQGVTDEKVAGKMQKLQEDFLLRRGFQPFWEDPNRRIRN